MLLQAFCHILLHFLNWHGYTQILRLLFHQLQIIRRIKYWNSHCKQQRWQNALTKLLIILNYFIHKFYFYCWKKLKNVHFHSKIAWPPATYDTVSHNHSNWPLLNLSQNACKGWTNNYRKPQMLMFYHVGKKNQKNLRGMAATPPPSPCMSEGYFEMNCK